MKHGLVSRGALLGTPRHSPSQVSDDSRTPSDFYDFQPSSSKNGIAAPYGRPGTPLTVRAVSPFLPFTSTSILLQAAGGAVSLA
jgi:hypothetical protein